MMGTSHALSGAAAWVAATAAVPGALGLAPMEPVYVTAGAVITAGAALLPDADHHNATIAHSVPGVGAAAAGVVGAVSGGHRHGMHSILAVVLVWFGTSWLGAQHVTFDLPWGSVPLNVGATVAVVGMTTFATKVLKLVPSWSRAWLYGGLAGALLAVVMPGEQPWLQLAVTLGYAVHIFGDALTVEGVPLLWPIPARAPKFVANTPVLGAIWKGNGYFSLPVLGSTGSIREGALAGVLALYSVLVIGASWVIAFDLL